MIHADCQRLCQHPEPCQPGACIKAHHAALQPPVAAIKARHPAWSETHPDDDDWAWQWITHALMALVFVWVLVTVAAVAGFALHFADTTQMGDLIARAFDAFLTRMTFK